MAFLQDQPEALRDIQPVEAQSLFPRQEPEDLTALRLVVGDMKKAEAWANMFMWRFNRYDDLYLFRVPMAFWEGTTVPRAHLGVPLVYEHIESLLPQVINTLFLQLPPFMSRPRPGTSMQAARANDGILGWELDQTFFREQIRLLAKSALLYGTGIGKWGWLTETKPKVRVRRVGEPPSIEDPLTGRPQQIETPDTDDLEIVVEDEVINRPTFEALDLRHVFVDPGLRLPDVRKAKYAIHQAYMTIRQLDALRDVEGYDIPDQKRLVSFFFPPKEEAIHSLASQTTGGSLASFTKEFEPAKVEEDTSVNPLEHPLEVLEYWSKDRVVTVLQRKLVLRSERNEFNVIPFVSTVYSDVPNQFYGIGVTQLIGPEQRLQQGVINARLDDLSLMMNGMFIRVRGANTPTQQIRVRPGGVIDSDQKDGVTPIDRKPAVPESFAEIDASDKRAQRRTGANELVVQGTIPSSGSTFGRTATGINALSAGAGTRIQYFIENLADQVYVPVLRAFTEMNRTRLVPSQIQRVLSEELAIQYEGDALDILNGRFEFEILAAGKLQARSSMAQSLPLLFQFITNEPVIAALAEQGRKVNFAELVNMVFDVSGWPNKTDVIVAMTPQEQQRRLMSTPAVAQQALAQQKAQLKADDAEKKLEGQAGRDILKAIIEEEGARGAAESAG
jgi:hypothetical protein